MSERLRELNVVPVGEGEIRLLVPQDSDVEKLGLQAEIRNIEISVQNLKPVFETLAANATVVFLTLIEGSTVKGEDIYVLRDSLPSSVRQIIVVTDQRAIVAWGMTLGDFPAIRAAIKHKVLDIDASVDIFPVDEMPDAQSLFWEVIEAKR